MSQQLVDRQDQDFVIWEQINCAEILSHEKYREFNPKTCSLIINEARALAIKELLPLLAEGDTEGVRFENGAVKVPQGFHRVFELIKEGEWNNLSVPASKKALDKAGLKAADIDFWEINEAFCIVALNCIQQLGLDPQTVNVMGGGTAIGHPLGATGIRLTGTLARILNVKGGRYGCANACVGGGQGVATIIEREEYQW